MNTERDSWVIYDYQIHSEVYCLHSGYSRHPASVCVVSTCEGSLQKKERKKNGTLCVISDDLSILALLTH